jgi:hypothetical protein
MVYDYVKARAIAQRQITKYGSSATVVKKGTTGGYDENGDVLADVADTELDGIITPLAFYTNKEIDGSLIKNGDAWVYFHSEDVPEVNMQVTINSKTFRVVSIHSLDSVSGENIFRKLQLRS